MTIGIAVIGAGMAGRAHAAAYRSAPTLYRSTLPDLRFISIGDISPELGSLAARRFGYEHNDTSWQAIAENPDINVVSVVVANSLHSEIVEGLVAAGKQGDKLRLRRTVRLGPCARECVARHHPVDGVADEGNELACAFVGCFGVNRALRFKQVKVVTQQKLAGVSVE